MKQWFGEKFLGLPPLASTNGQGVDDLIIYVHWLMLALFIGWIIYFFYVLRRFRSSRNPKADYVGVKSHASNYLELAVAGVEAVLLIFVAVPLWARQVAQFPVAKRIHRHPGRRATICVERPLRRSRRRVRQTGHEIRHAGQRIRRGPGRPGRQGRHPVAQRNSRARQQAGHHLSRLQGRGAFAENHRHAGLSGRDSRPARSGLVHAHDTSANTRSTARNCAATAIPPCPAAT